MNVSPTNQEISFDSLLSFLRPKSHEEAEAIAIPEPTDTKPLDSQGITPTKPKLVGIIGQGDSKTALVCKASDMTPVMLAEHSTLDAIGLVGLIERITADGIIVAREQSKITILLGEHFDF